MGLEENIVIVPGKRRVGSRAGGIQEGPDIRLANGRLTKHREQAIEKENKNY